MTLRQVIEALRSMQPKRDPKFAGVRADLIITVDERGDVMLRCRGRDRGYPWIYREHTAMITSEAIDETAVDFVDEVLSKPIQDTVTEVIDAIAKADERGAA